MLRRCLAHALLVVAVSGVRDISPAFSTHYHDLVSTGNVSMTRLDQGTNTSTTICEAKTVERDTYYCLSLAFPLPVFPALKVEGALRIRFISDVQNCFKFVVTAAVGVRVLFFSAHVEFEYTMEQQARSKSVKCAEVRPTSDIVMGYIVRRVTQWMKGQTSSTLISNDGKVREQWTKLKADWTKQKNNPPITVANLGISMIMQYIRTKERFQNIRTRLQGRMPGSIPDAITMILGAHGYAMKVNMPTSRRRDLDGSNSKTIESCFDLKTSPNKFHEWLWCYFTSMYEFSADAYRDLITQTGCLDTTGQEHMSLWEGVTANSMGLLVEANADICKDALGHPANCVLSFPREFLAMYPCTSNFLITYLIFSDEAYSGGAALELIWSAIEQQWGDAHYYAEDGDHKGKKIKITRDPYDHFDEHDMEMHRTTIFNNVQQRVTNSRDLQWSSRGADWEKYLGAYSIFLARLTKPEEGGERMGFAGAVRPPSFRIKDTFGIAFSLHSSNLLEKQTTSFCSAPYMEFRAFHVWNLNTWTNDKSCISGRAWIAPVKQTSVSGGTLWMFRLDPKWCWDYERQESTFKFPIGVRHGFYACTWSFFQQLLNDDPEKTICLNIEALSFRVVNDVLKDLIRELAPPAIPSGRPTKSTIGTKLAAIRDVLSATILAAITIMAENAALGLLHSAVDGIIAGLSAIMPAGLESECLHYSQQIVELTDVPSKREDAIQDPKVGWYDELQLKVGPVVVKAMSQFEASFGSR